MIEQATITHTTDAFTVSFMRVPCAVCAYSNENQLLFSFNFSTLLPSLKCIGLWWPLEDCTKENGCLWAVPGSHKDGVKRLFVRNPNGEGTVFEGEEENFDLTNAGKKTL